MSRSPYSSPAATIGVLKEHGLYTRKSLGQHFLVDDNVLGRILDLAGLTGDEVVTEVGPGIGTLTWPLCDRARGVVAIERDERLAEVLEHTVPRDNLAVIRADALDISAEDLDEPFGAPVALIANLPYQVAATLVLRFFQTIPSLAFAVVMVQSEVADRMAASPGTKDYGAYTVKLRLLADPAGRFAVAPGCFLPPPRVDSAVIRLERKPVAEDRRTLEAATLVTEAAFGQRRKTLRNALRSGLAKEPSEVEALLTTAGIDPTRRAESLTTSDFLRLGELGRKLGLLP